MTGQQYEAVMEYRADVLDALDLSSRVFEPTIEGIWASRSRVHGKVNTCTRRHIVDDDRQVGALRDRLEVAYNAFLARLVIIGSDNEGSVGTAGLGRGRMGDRQFGAVGPVPAMTGTRPREVRTQVLMIFSRSSRQG